MRARRIALVATLCLFALPPVITHAAASKFPHVRQVSRDSLACPQSDPHCEHDTVAEPHVAVNVDRPNNVVGVFQVGRYAGIGAAANGFATSFDGGGSWVHGYATDLTVAVAHSPSPGDGPPYERASDPAIAYDRKHDVWLFESVGLSVRGCASYCTSAITVNRSTTAGKTFGPPVVVHQDVSDQSTPPVFLNDKPWIAVDNNQSSRYYGRAYATWTRYKCADPTCAGGAPSTQLVEISVSDDGGATWSSPIQAVKPRPGSTHVEVGAQPVVLSNGHLVVVYVDIGHASTGGELEAIRSTTGGVGWSSPVSVLRLDPYPEEKNGLRAPPIPSIAVDSRKVIWVAVQDQRFKRGRNDIVLVKSLDEGETWAPPTSATPRENDLDHFSPAIAAIGWDLYMTYRVHEAKPVRGAPDIDVIFRKLRAGKTVRGPSKIFRASDASFAAYTSTSSLKLRFFGDYAGIAASKEAVFPIWCHSQHFPGAGTNSTRTHQRVFVTRLKR
jgi:hypothetical protein